jgi:hypothetical protein
VHSFVASPLEEKPWATATALVQEHEKPWVTPRSSWSPGDMAPRKKTVLYHLIASFLQYIVVILLYMLRRQCSRIYSLVASPHGRAAPNTIRREAAFWCTKDETKSFMCMEEELQSMAPWKKGM